MGSPGLVAPSRVLRRYHACSPIPRLLTLSHFRPQGRPPAVTQPFGTNPNSQHTNAGAAARAPNNNNNHANRHQLLLRQPFSAHHPHQPHQQHSHRTYSAGAAAVRREEYQPPPPPSPRTIPTSSSSFQAFFTAPSMAEKTQAAAANGTVPFSELQGRLHPQLLAALRDMKYTTMSMVQERVLDGKLLPDLTQDAVVRARTGTGKTTAFLLPTLQNLLSSQSKDGNKQGAVPRGQVGILIISPTRELAVQIAKECDQLTRHCSPSIDCHLAYGGTQKASNLNRFVNGSPSVLVATPGRLLDYLNEDRVRAKFSNLRALVLDEADRLLDEGFFDDIMKILKLLPAKAKAGWQGLCFSATMPPKIHTVLHNVVAKNSAVISTIAEGEVPTVNSIPQAYVPVDSIYDVLPAVHSMLSLAHRESGGGGLKAIVFSHTARNAGLMYELFTQPGVSPGGITAYPIHSRMSQPARNRTIEEFKKPGPGLLFASDVVGRGLDFPDVGLVIQVGLPMESDQYVHRVGRTGRAGKTGRASMILLPLELPFIRANQQYPIVKTEMPDIEASRAVIETALGKIPEKSKSQAYVGYIGYLKQHGRLMKIKGADIVQHANEFSEALGLPEPPALEAKTIGKMGLKGVPGLRIAKAVRQSPRHQQKEYA